MNSSFAAPLPLAPPGHVGHIIPFAALPVLPQALCPPLQPQITLTLASHFLLTLALNFPSRLQYPDELFPPRGHYLQGRKQGSISPWRKSLLGTQGPRWKHWGHSLPHPPFVPVDFMLPKKSQEIKPHPWVSATQPSLPSLIFLLPSHPVQHIKPVLLNFVTQSKRIILEANHTPGFRTSKKTFNSPFRALAILISDSILWNMVIRK